MTQDTLLDLKLDHLRNELATLHAPGCARGSARLEVPQLASRARACGGYRRLRSPRPSRW